MAGAPKGNRNAKKAKDWESALRRALAQYEDPENKVAPGQALKKIAENVVKQAIAGSKDAITEIACRLDGKPTEYIETDVTHRFASELSDDELEAIASGSSDGAADSPESPPTSAPVH